MSELDTIVEAIVKALDAKKATAIAVFDVEGNNALTDRVVVVSANNEVHCRALMEAMQSLSKEDEFKNSDELFKPARVSGSPDSGWLVVDLNSVLVHILTVDMRAHYDLDSIYEKRASSVEHI
ncbi:MAG: ribosome silencing factor [bacterium]|nr:ribosome silencing factor [bacterium]